MTTTSLRLLSVAPLDWRFCHDDLLLALRGLVDGGVDVSLRVEGDGRERERFFFQRHDLGIADRVTLAARTREGPRGYDALVVLDLDPSLDTTVRSAAVESAARARVLVTTTLAAPSARRSLPAERVVEVPPLSPDALLASLRGLARAPVSHGP